MWPNRLTRADRFREFFEVNPFDDFEPRYNIAPSQPVIAICQTGSRRAVCRMRWGLIPSWAKDMSIGNKTINCRSETVLEKPAFRESFLQRRCLIPADGFYEWKKVGRFRQPFHFGMRDDSLFAFAGLWDRWRGPGGNTIESCSILTTTPNELLADVHDRMPVILPPSQYEAWLLARATDASRLTGLLVPYDAAEMRSYPVSSQVNSPQNEGPACVEEVDPSLGSSGSLFGS